MFRQIVKKYRQIWDDLGPGLITGASDDDPSGITTYSQAGSAFGLKTLWSALITLPLMSAIQEMCGRIGLVTGEGIAKVIKKHYPIYVIYLVTFLSIPAIILNIGANLQGMGAVTNLLLPEIPIEYATVFYALVLVSILIVFSYKTLQSFLKWMCLILFVYLIIPFLSKQDLSELALATFIPYFEYSKDYIAMLVAILGTTISPYLFYWEASSEVEDSRMKHFSFKDIASYQEQKELIKRMRKDNFAGMFLSNLIMYFIILTAATFLFRNGITNITNIDQAANALRPLAGDNAYLLFAIGVIGTGSLSIPVLAGSSAYLFAETFNWNEGMNTKIYEAKGFYGIIIVSILSGLIMNFLNVNPVQALIWTAIIYGLISPILIGILLLVCNNKKIMGKFTNGWVSNLLGGICFVLMSVVAVSLIITLF
jgi:NRAMP (natural resistance-associated macrophage protein)-like metal ion transporter